MPTMRPFAICFLRSIQKFGAVIGLGLLSLAEQKKADWILNGGIEKEWDSYLDKMEKYGLSDYLAIKQKYFDQYQKSLSEENK